MNKIISNDLNLILLKLDLFTGMLENNFELSGTKSAKILIYTPVSMFGATLKKYIF